MQAIRGQSSAEQDLPKDRNTQDSWRTQLIADPATFMSDDQGVAGAGEQLRTRITSSQQ